MLSERFYNFAAGLVILLLALVAGVVGYLKFGTKPDDGLRPPLPSYLQPNESKVRRDLANVWLRARDASATWTNQLTDNDWHKLEDGDHVSTDTGGEGLLNINGCMSIYVYRDSELMAAPCSKSEHASGSVICSIAGTSAFNNSCRNKVTIQTDSAEILLHGTWVTVTYVPRRQLSLVTVEKGGATILPVKRTEGRVLADPIEVGEGQYCFTAPGERPQPIHGLPARPALRQAPLPAVGKELNLTPLSETIKKQAERDNVSPPVITAPTGGEDGAGNEGEKGAEGEKSKSGEDRSENVVGPSVTGKRPDVRQRMLRLLAKRDMTKAEIERRLGLTDAAAGRWLRVLLKEREIKVVKTKPVRYRRPHVARSRKRKGKYEAR